jgi:hypothetical protein
MDPLDVDSAVAVLEDELLLTRYAIRPKDSHTEVELRWRVARRLSADYFAFVHALDAAGAVVFQADHQLRNSGGGGTSVWTAKDSVVDRFLMSPPADHLAGQYTLRIGVWDPKSRKFLKILQTRLLQPQDGWRGRAFLIDHVECK